MKRAESIELLDEFWHKCMKRGLPMNVRQGQTIDFADYVLGILQDCVEIDEPTGVVKHNDYDACPKCGGSIGTTGYYCRHCGNLIRYKPEGR